MCKTLPIKEQEILNYLTRKLEVDYVDIQHNLSTIVIVGENMKSQIGAHGAPI